MSKIVKFPNVEEINQRLKKVLDDHTFGNLAPLIAKEADREYAAKDVVLMLVQKIHDLISSGYPAVAKRVLSARIPDMIDALIDDEEVAEEAKKRYEEAMN